MEAHTGRGKWRRCAGPDRSARRRRMALLKRMGLFGEAGGAEITRAMTLGDLYAAYRLVHDIYVAKGYILPRPDGMRIRHFECLPTTVTFLARVDDRVVGVLSLVTDGSALGLPSDEAFRAELDCLRGPGRVLCEATNQVVAEEFRRSPLTTEMMRCAFAHALAAGCTDFLGTVSPSHVAFYEMLGFQAVSGVRSYSDEIDDPVVVVCLDIASLGERFRRPDFQADECEQFLKRYYIDENPYHQRVRKWMLVPPVTLPAEPVVAAGRPQGS